MVTGVLSIKEVLTPEQYKKFKDTIKEYKCKGWGNHKGMKKMHKEGFGHEKGE